MVILHNKMNAKSRTVIYAYKNLHFLIQCCMQWASTLVVMGETIGLLLSSLALYFASGSRGNWLERTAFVTLLFICGAASSFLLQACGKSYLISRNLISGWKRAHSLEYHCVGNQEGKIERRILKTLRPIKVYLKVTYLIDEKTILLSWDYIIDKTILFLCVFPLN